MGVTSWGMQTQSRAFRRSSVGDRLTGEQYHEGMNAREYLVLIGNIGVGKDTSINRAMDFAQAFGLVFHPDRKKGVPFTEIGCMTVNTASEPALYRAAEKHSRLLLKPEEFDQLLSKTNAEMGGQALLALLRGLFDRPYITGSTTEERKSSPSVCFLSLLTSTQPETFKQLISKKGGLGTGFASRLTLVVNEETRTTEMLDKPRWLDLQKLWVEKV